MTVETRSMDWRAEWTPIDDVTYLNFAAHSAAPRVALEAVEKSLEAMRRPHVIDDARYFQVAADLRRSLASLIGANPDEIALTTGAGAGVMTVAYALPWSPGDEVLIASGEFPTMYATWKPMEARAGIKLRIVTPQDRFNCADDLINALTPRTRLISISHVRFDDGSLLDVRRLADACKANGTLLLLDVSQSCGAIPMDVRSLGADFIVCAGYKYLLSPVGTGFLWIKKEHLQSLQSGPYNWETQGPQSVAQMNFVNPGPSPTMSRWDSAEAASPYNFNLTVMEASTRFVLRVGPETVRRHAQGLIGRLFAGLPQGCHVASPMSAVERGAYGCIVADRREDTEKLYQALLAEQIVISLREGRIRIAPHLMNTEDDIDRTLEAISKATRKMHVKH
ncbi:MAG: aminotransferase class V-fold PLP-dependent enzyme [Rhodanobacteraceae bacterium]|nr:aminotransferase class V-fold PLP-dependent enzyme [Rhodanobacteraceae bacterium]